MESSLSIPTDNIFKFYAISGLALLLASILSFVYVYDSHLDKKISYNEKIIRLDVKKKKTEEEIQSLEMYKTLLNIAKKNESFYASTIGGIAGISIILIGYGFRRWHSVVQKRDDELTKLQIDMLKKELRKPLTIRSRRTR